MCLRSTWCVRTLFSDEVHGELQLTTQGGLAGMPTSPCSFRGGRPDGVYTTNTRPVCKCFPVLSSLSEKHHPEDCNGSGPVSLSVWLFLLEASNTGERAGRIALAEFTDELSQIPMRRQHKNSCYLWILRLCFVTVRIRIVFKTFIRHKYTCH